MGQVMEVFRHRRIGTRLFFITGLILITFLLMLPCLVAFSTSLKPYADIFSKTPTIIPHHVTLTSYKKLLHITEFPGYLLHSFLVAGCTALASVMASVPAAYALRFLIFRGRRLLARSLMVAYMFPAVTLVFPMFFLAGRLELLDTTVILVLANLSFALPIAVWMLTGFFEKIPSELEKAARVDGCNRYQVMRYVLLPVMMPGVIAIGTFAFILAWGEYLFSMTLTDTYRTASAGMHALIGNYRVDYGLLTAAGAVVTLPVIVLFAVFQKFIVEGLTSASTKL